MSAPALELDRVVKRFGGRAAVAGVSIALRAGELHALIGENGAGKSTALAMASGGLAPDEGEVRAFGARLSPATPHEAMRRGVGLVHQHFKLVDAFSALDNALLGFEPMRGFGRIDRARARARIEAVARDAGLAVALDAEVGTLSVGDRQRLEIVRVLYRDARVILLDEPTAVLTPAEAKELYATLRRLADAGRAVAVVTHRLDEVVAHADRFTVLRRGEAVLAGERGSATEAELAAAVVGGAAPARPSRPRLAPDAEVRLAVELAVAHAGETGRERLRVRRGEIVGIAGVEGNGQREIVDAIAGLAPGADVTLDGARVAGGPSERRARGLVVVHEDRHVEGLVLGASVSDNLVLDAPGERDAAARVARRMREYDVQPPDANLPASALSGGNQQKIVVARALDRAVSAAVIAQPTRGVDVGSAVAIHRAIARAAEAGAAVVIVSADLSELRALSHRLLVVHRGRFVLDGAPDLDDESLGRAMLGAATREVA